MSTFTPGPWGIEQTDDTNWIGFMRPHNPNKVEIIVCAIDRHLLNEESLKKNDANARLIAAAPELLEALVRLESELVEEKYGADYEPFHYENLGVARAAIAKATGQ